MVKPTSRSQPPTDPESSGPLTSAQFHILLTLAEGRRHGYGIMQEIAQRTEGALELGPGTLYRSLKQLLDRGLIAEAGDEPETTAAGNRSRRSYELTPSGRIRTAEEARRLQELVEWARESMVLKGAG
jgi:DNA-binding PadR family transcriptional regulator